MIISHLDSYLVTIRTPFPVSGDVRLVLHLLQTVCLFLGQSSRSRIDKGA